MGRLFRKTTVSKKSQLLKDNRENIVLEDGRKMLAEAGLSEDDVEYYSERLAAVMDDYTEHFGEGTELKYFIRRRFDRIEIKLSIPGEEYDPFENGNDALRRQIEKQLTLNVGS